MGNEVQGFCDGNGQCAAEHATMQIPACVTAVCDGKSCADTCTLAGKPGKCRDDGVCDTEAFPTCAGYDPCFGKGCGDVCNLCPPGADCPPTQGRCSSRGACLQGLPPGCHDCVENSSCYAGELTQLCTDASIVKGNSTCEQFQCVYEKPECGPPECGPRDAKGTEGCSNDLGWYWNGSACVYVTGCVCEGVDCGNHSFDTEAHCNEGMAPCMHP